jgi:hypothetical protein
MDDDDQDKLDRQEIRRHGVRLAELEERIRELSDRVADPVARSYSHNLAAKLKGLPLFCKLCARWIASQIRRT